MRFIILLFSCLFFVIPMVEAKVEIDASASKIITLPADAASVIVGNPQHVTVTMDNPRMMVMTAGAPGVTQVIVLGVDSKVIWSDTVAVNRPSETMIRVRNACINAEGDGCQPVRLFNCEAGAACDNVNIIEPMQNGGRRR